MKRPREGGGDEPGPSATLSVRVLPRSSKEAVDGFSEGIARIRLTAPPLDNRANEALVRFLSREIGVPRRQVEIVAGARGRSKVVRVQGVAEEELYRRLGLQRGKGVPEG